MFPCGFPWPTEVSDQPRSVARSRDATKFGNVFPFGFSDWTFLERENGRSSSEVNVDRRQVVIDGLVSHVAQRGWCREGGAPLAVEQDAIKREPEPACNHPLRQRAAFWGLSARSGNLRTERINKGAGC